ncbi:MAG TPA: amidohydrolase [Anaerolineae bacterium]|nr:amidohydrolase [Anaerolineae bacterium]
MRLLIEDCAVLDADQPQGYASGQYLVLEDNLITAVTGQRPGGEFDRVISGADRLAIPGLINAHTHSPENFLRATTDRLALEPWLVHLFGMCGEFSARDYYLSIMLGVIEMVRSGVTGVVDHFWMNPPLNAPALEAAMSAYRDSGLRAAVAPLYRDAQYDVDYGIVEGYPLADTFFAQFGRQFPPLAEMLAVVDTFIQRWHGAEQGRLRVLVGPSGLQWCSEALLQQSLELARRYQTGFHMHLLETGLQAWACRRRFGGSGVAWLAERGLLGPEVSLPHSVWLTPDDVECLARTGASVVHNPAANLKLGSGLAPVRTMLDYGVPVALGTDGAASSDNQVLFEALRLAALIHNPGEAEPERWLSAREAWQMATTAGAVVMGLPGRLGQLKPGYLADLALLDLNSPHLLPLNDAYRHLAFCESGASVRTVIVDGRVVMHEGFIEAFDEAAILAEIRQAVAGRPHQQPVPPAIAEAIEKFKTFQMEVTRHERLAAA